MITESVCYVGLDVHKRVVAACLVDATGKVVHRERFALNRRTLELFATKVLRPSDQVALEATTNCWAVSDALRPHVAKVLVSNPMATKAIAQAKVKTDKVDAHVLAQLLRCNFLPEVWQPDRATRQLRELTGRRSALVGQRTMMRNRIHAVLAVRLIEVPFKTLFSLEALNWLATAEIDAQGRLLIDSDLKQLEDLQQQIATLDTELARRGHASDAVKLLMTLPGVDVATAEALLAAWGDMKRFVDGDHAASYLGLTPSTKQSAERCYHGPITKRGNSQARWMLTEAAQHLDTHPGPLGHFFRRLLRKKTRNVAVVAAARKLAVIGWTMLDSNEPYRYAIPKTAAVKLSRLRVKATGQRRPGGVPKGQKAMATQRGQTGGSRTIRSLPDVCQSEGLPLPLPLSSGERRMVKEAGCDAFVEQLGRTQVVPRRTNAPKAKAQANQAAIAHQDDMATELLTAATSAAPLRRRTSGRARQASCQMQTSTKCRLSGFRPHRAGEQGDEAPPPAPPTLSSVPGRRRVAAKKSAPAS
jgi:transposase